MPDLTQESIIHYYHDSIELFLILLSLLIGFRNLFIEIKRSLFNVKIHHSFTQGFIRIVILNNSSYSIYLSNLFIENSNENGLDSSIERIIKSDNACEIIFDENKMKNSEYINFTFYYLAKQHTLKHKL